MQRKRYLGRVEILPRAGGKQQFHHLGRFDSKRARDLAVLEARRDRPWELTRATETSCEVWADRFIGRMRSGALRARGGRPYKDSTIDTLETQLRAFRRDFGDRTPASITQVEAEDWAATVAPSSLPAVVQLFNYLLRHDELELGRNRFTGLSHRQGRKDRTPPAEDQMLALIEACSALGDYAPVMRSMFTFAAYTLMRPCELIALAWDNIDQETGRILIDERYYRGKTDVPKSGKPRVVALTAPALQALEDLGRVQGYPTGGLVFRNKSGRRLTAPTMSAYWKEVRARARLEHEFYVATKHYGVWYMKVRLGLPDAVIAAQAGWSESAVTKMVATYGHAVDERRLAEIDAAFAAVTADCDTDCDTRTPDRQ